MEKKYYDHSATLAGQINTTLVTTQYTNVHKLVCCLYFLHLLITDFQPLHLNGINPNWESDNVNVVCENVKMNKSRQIDTPPSLNFMMEKRKQSISASQTVSAADPKPYRWGLWKYNSGNNLHWLCQVTLSCQSSQKGSQQLSAMLPQTTFFTFQT